MDYPIFVFVSVTVIASTAAVCFLLRAHQALLALAAGVGATLVLVMHGPLYFDYYADDAYITLRYSRHLADGLGPNWNSTGSVEGYTSFAWMAIHAGLTKLGANPVDASQILGALAVLATFGCVYLIWRLWNEADLDSGAASPAVLVATMLCLAVTDGVAFWGFSGMETPFFTAMLTASAYLFLREMERGGPPWSAFGFALTAMSRPEGVIAAGVTASFVTLDVVRADRRGRAIQRAALWGGAFIALYGPYFLWRYTYYDALLPNTFYAKVGPTNASLDRGLDYLWTYGLRYQVVAVFVGIAFLLLRRRLRTHAAYIAVLTGTLLTAVVVEGGDVFPHGRFIVPVLPLLYLSGLTGFATALKRLALEPVQVAIVITALLSLAVLSLLRGSSQFEHATSGERAHLEQREVLGRWLSNHTPPHYKIAAFAVGALGYYTDRYVLDLLGINDPVIAHTDVPEFGEGLAGHEKYNADYVYDRIRPEIIVISDAESEAKNEEMLRRAAFREPSPVVARNELLQDPRLWERYEARSLKIGDLWFNFLQRADTVDDLRAPNLR